jgi:hypothetical protein
VTYLNAAGKRRIYVFGVDDTGRLVTRYHKGAGFNWEWTTQGGPSLEHDALEAKTFLDDEGVQRIQVFAIRKPSIDVNGRLVTNYWDGASWHWATMQSKPGDIYPFEFLEATDYIGNDGRRRLDLFCGRGDLIRHSWVAGQWTLTDYGGDTFPAVAVTNYLTATGDRHVHVFMDQAGSGQFRDLFNGNFIWLPTPSGESASYPDSLAADAFTDIYNNVHMNLFATWGGSLRMRPWHNGSWQPWVTIGIPPYNIGGNLMSPAVLSYRKSRDGEQQFFVFLSLPQGNLVAAFWNGSEWLWIDHGVR